MDADEQPPRRPPRSRVRVAAYAVLGVLVLAALTWGLYDVRRRARVDPLHPGRGHITDVTVYTEAAAAFLGEGEGDPYEVTNVRRLRYLYPPLFALVVSPLARLGPEDQATVWYLVSVLLCAGACWEGLRIARIVARSDARLDARRQVWLPRLAVLAAVAGFCPVVDSLQRGQVGILLLFLLLLGVRLVLQARSPWRAAVGGIVLAAPVAVKVTVALPVALVLVMLLAGAAARRSRREGGRFAGAAGGAAVGLALWLLLVPAAVIGWGDNLRHLATWTRFVRENAVAVDARAYAVKSRSIGNQSLDNAVRLLGNFAAWQAGRGPDSRLGGRRGAPPMPMDAPVVGRILLAVRVALVAAMFAACVLLALAGPGAPALAIAAGLAIGCAGMLVVSPLSWTHHFVFLAALMPVALWLWRLGWRRTAAAMAVWPAALSVMAFAAKHAVGQLGLLGLGLAGWLAAALVLVAAGSRHAAATS